MYRVSENTAKDHPRPPEQPSRRNSPRESCQTTGGVQSQSPAYASSDHAVSCPDIIPWAAGLAGGGLGETGPGRNPGSGGCRLPRRTVPRTVCATLVRPVGCLPCRFGQYTVTRPPQLRYRAQKMGERHGNERTPVPPSTNRATSEPKLQVPLPWCSGGRFFTEFAVRLYCALHRAPNCTK